MRRLTNVSRGTHLPSATINGMQDEQIGLIAATDPPAVALKGADVRFWETLDAGLPTGQLRVIDTSVDWRNRLVWGQFRNLGAADRRLGRTANHLAVDPTTAGVAIRSFCAETGAGGKGAAAVAIINGTPPVLADDAVAVVLDEAGDATARVWLYADPTTHALCVYNNSGATLHGDLVVFGAGAAITPGAAPPSVIPALTEVQWLEPSTAALRPADPGGPAIHRATDTSAITLWDGGAWRVLGGGGSAIPPPALLPLCPFATCDGVLSAVGRVRLDPALYALAGLTLAVTLEVIGDVSAASLTGTVTLYDLTAAATVATLSWTGAPETSPIAKTAVVAVPGAARLYELRAELTGGAGYLTLGGAVLRLTWS